MNTTTTARQHGRPAAAVATNWPIVLLAVLAAIYLVFGFIAGPVGLLGVAGAAAIVVALGIARRSRSIATTVLVAGTIPFAVATWWSVAVPLTGILIVTIGVPEIARQARNTGNGAPDL